MKSEKTKISCEREHQLKMREHLLLQQQINAISKDVPKSLRQAKYEFTVYILWMLSHVNVYKNWTIWVLHFRPHRSISLLQSFAADRAAWSVCLSVMTVSPAHMMNRSRCHLGCEFGWAQGTMYYMGSNSPHTKGRSNFEGEREPA